MDVKATLHSWINSFLMVQCLINGCQLWINNLIIFYTKYNVLYIINFFYFQIKYIVFCTYDLLTIFKMSNVYLKLSSFLENCEVLCPLIHVTLKKYNVPKLNRLDKYLNFLIMWIYFLMGPCDFLSDNVIYATYLPHTTFSWFDGKLMNLLFYFFIQ